MKSICWKCGQKRKLQLVYGFPICNKCSKDFDPEDMEGVVIDYYRDGKLAPLDKGKEGAQL